MSNGRDKDRSRASRAVIRDLFMRDWDPIGVRDEPAVQDEYDDYVGKVYVMLMDEQATAQAIVDYLQWAETDHMGLTDTAERRDRRHRLSEALVALRSQFSAPQ